VKVFVKEVESMSEDKWLHCPYNSNHHMPSTRLQWHLVKCPDKKRFGHLYSVCPYNAQHIILKSEMTNHKVKCPDKDENAAESDEIDRQIREYLANQHHTATWDENHQNGWVPAPQLIVGETIENPQASISIESSSKVKNQKRNAKRNKKITEETESHTKSTALGLDEQRVEEKSTEIDSNPSTSSEDGWNVISIKKNKPPKSTPVENKKVEDVAKPKVDEPTTKQQKQPSEECNTEEQQKDMKKIKNCQKLLKQITEIERKERGGVILNEDQKLKKGRKIELEAELKKLTIS